jgi:hypothetical protein
MTIATIQNTKPTRGITSIDPTFQRIVAVGVWAKEVNI